MSLRGSFRLGRISKFKHVFGNPFKKDRCFEAVRITKNAWDSNFCAVNPKFLAVVLESSGGGAFLVLKHDEVGRVSINAPKVAGHRGGVLDIKWNPFDDNIIASASEDCTVKVWYIPDDGLAEDLVDYIGDLRGHERKVGIIEWHPTANGILASAGFDHLVIVWDVEREAAVTILKGHSDTIYSLSWNWNGSYIATSCKDKKIRVIDPREGRLIASGSAHKGPKGMQVVFLGNTNKLFTTGFSQCNERQVAIWDLKSLKKPLAIESVDSSSGMLLPYYDPDTRMLYVAGKGDGNIRYYEILDDPREAKGVIKEDGPYFSFLNEYRSSSPQRGLGVMPKRGVDVSTCEILRFYKLHNNGYIEPIQMTVPRRQTGVIQADLYPTTAASVPALSADEWLDGCDANPVMMNLLEGYDLPPSQLNHDKPEEKSESRNHVSPPKHMKQPPKPVAQEEKVQVVRAKAVNSAPNHDVIQVSAQEVRNAKNELTNNPKEFESWDIHNLQLAFMDQQTEINFLKEKLKDREAQIWHLEKENRLLKDKLQAAKRH